MASAPPGGGGLLAGLGPGTVHRLGRGLNGLDDVHVPRAPAEIAFEALADLVLGRVRVLVEEVGGGHDEAGSAVPALEAVLIPERLLQWVQLAVLGHALGRCQAFSLNLDFQHWSAFYRPSLRQDGACAALAGVAADVR